MDKTKLNILLFDIETAPNLAYVWEKYEQDVILFVKERYMLSFAYKWLSEKRVKCFCLNDVSEKELVKKLHSLFEKADVICGHNCDEFDIKMSNSFFAKFNLRPPSPYKTIDTLKIARSKFRFNSNKLNDLATYLGIGHKIDTGGFKLWLGCLKNDPDSWKKMKRYNRRDVVLLEKVYKILFPWIKTTININLTEGIFCPACGSNHMNSHGFEITRNYKKQRLQCMNCGRWSYGRRYKFRNVVCS